MSGLLADGTSLHLKTLLESIVADIEAFIECTAHNSLELLEVVFRASTPVVNHNRADVTQGEESSLLHWLLIWAEML